MRDNFIAYKIRNRCDIVDIDDIDGTTNYSFVNYV